MPAWLAVQSSVLEPNELLRACSSAMPVGCAEQWSCYGWAACHSVPERVCRLPLQGYCGQLSCLPFLTVVQGLLGGCAGQCHRGGWCLEMWWCC